jgi:hypothetical protein
VVKKAEKQGHDQLIVEALEGYRAQKEFANEGGYQKLSQYLRRDYKQIGRCF